MIPLGYLAKRIPNEPPNWLHAPEVVDVYSVSGCVNDSLAEYSDGWKHNGFWMFDSPADIQTAAVANGIDLKDASLFFHEAYESEFDGMTGFRSCQMPRSRLKYWFRQLNTGRVSTSSPSVTARYRDT